MCPPGRRILLRAARRKLIRFSSFTTLFSFILAGDLSCHTLIKLEKDQHISAGGLDRKGFEMLFRAHFKGLSYFALEYVKDVDIAREIVQEIFARLWEKRESIDPQSNTVSYLGTAVRNRCLNHIRDNRKFSPGMLELEGLGDEHSYVEQDELVTEELKQKITEATDALPEKCRNIFLLNRMENKKYQEIADELDISVKTVEAQMSKALKIMRDKLKEFMAVLLTIIEIININ